MVCLPHEPRAALESVARKPQVQPIFAFTFNFVVALVPATHLAAVTRHRSLVFEVLETVIRQVRLRALHVFLAVGMNLIILATQLLLGWPTT